METQVLEQDAAQALMRLESAFNKLDLPKFSDRLGALETLCDGFKGLDSKKVQEFFDAQKAFNEDVKRAIKGRRDGWYISGLEDAPFRLDRAMLGFALDRGRRGGYERAGAMQEFEIMRQTYDAAVKNYGDPVLKAAGISAANTESAANFIADQLLSEIVPAIYNMSAFINLTGDQSKGSTRVRVLDGFMGGEKEMKTFLGGFVPFWVGSNEPIPESKMKTGELKFAPHKLGMLAALEEDLDLMGSGFNDLMTKDLQQRASEEVDRVIPFGAGGKEPLGICKTPGVQFYSAQAKAFGTIGTTTPDSLNGGNWAGGVLDFDALDALDLSMSEDKIRPNASKATIAGDRYFKRLKQLKVENYSSQTTGQPYLLGMPMLTNAKLAELIGPFADSTADFFLPSKPGAAIGATSAAGAVAETVIRGNLDEVLFCRWAGMQMTDDDGKGTGFAAGVKYVRLVMRVDSVVRQVRALRFCPDALVA